MNSLLAILFGLLAGVSYGSAPIFSKRAYGNGIYPIHIALISTIISTLVLLGMNIALYSISELILVFSTSGVIIFVTGGVLGSGVGRLLNFTGVEKVGASVNTSIIGIYPVIASVTAFVTLGESVSLFEGIGMLLAVLGVVVISISNSGDISGWSIAALVFPFTGAIAYGAAAVIRRYGFLQTQFTTIQATAVNEITAMFVLFAYLFAVSDAEAVHIISPPAILHGDGLPRNAYYYLFASGVLNTVAIVALFAALQAGPVFIGTTLSNASGLFAVGFSAVFLRDIERVTWVTVTGAGIVVTGVVLLTLPSIIN